MSAWPKKARVYLPGKDIAADIIDQLGLDPNVYSYLITEIGAIPVTFTVHRDGHIVATTLWRGEEEVGT